MSSFTGTADSLNEISDQSVSWTGHSSVTTVHSGKVFSLLGERQALTPHRSTFASYLPDGFCYGLGVYEDREQVVNIPFKLLIAF